MPEDCIFCKRAKEPSENYILENEWGYAVFDINPVTKGHALVIPKAHFDDLSSTDDKYLQGIILLVKQVAYKLKEIYPNIKGFNYVSNQGKEAKQVIFHLHIHIIPRY